MRMIEQHELASIGGGMTTVTIPKQKNDGGPSGRPGTVQIYTSTSRGGGGGGNGGGESGGGNIATPAPVQAKPTTTTSETVTQVCSDPRVTELSGGFQGFTIKTTPGGCITTRTYTINSSK